MAKPDDLLTVTTVVKLNTHGQEVETVTTASSVSTRSRTTYDDTGDRVSRISDLPGPDKIYGNGDDILVSTETFDGTR